MSSGLACIVTTGAQFRKVHGWLTQGRRHSASGVCKAENILKAFQISHKGLLGGLGHAYAT